jgi:hypothetical protein
MEMEICSALHILVGLVVSINLKEQLLQRRVQDVSVLNLFGPILHK